MGLFSKKTLVCESCGRNYEARVALGEHLCPECAARINQKRENLKGYVEYASRYLYKEYTEAELDVIEAHRQAIFEKHRCTGGISRAELLNAAQNRKNLTDDQCADILTRIEKCSVVQTIGSVYADHFFMPTEYPGTIVDAEDVFAVALSRDSRHKDDKVEVVLCTVFTNDPYVPVFSMILNGSRKLFDFGVTSEGRKDMAHIFKLICPNLTYDVQMARKLRKEVKGEGSVRGNIPYDVMMDKLDGAGCSFGVSNTKNTSSDLDSLSASLLETYGYIEEDEVSRILRWDKMIERRFWEKQMKKMGRN